jgi:hypothetical protein
MNAWVRPASSSEPHRGGTWVVETDQPVWAAAPGQACVFDDGEIVLGGGRIARPGSVASGTGAPQPATAGTAA